jgi:molybdate transport system substrate-binding protein
MSQMWVSQNTGVHMPKIFLSVLHLAFGTALSLLAALEIPRAASAEIKAFFPTALRGAITELLRDFESTSGHNVLVTYANIGVITGRVQNGEAADVVLVSPSQIDMLIREGKIVPNSKASVVKAGAGVAVRKGAAKPDISSVEAFKRSLFAAKSISYNDPSTGGPVGIYLVGLFERLGMAQDLKAKTRLSPGAARTLEFVAQGEVEIAITQASEIMVAPGVELVGPLPDAIQNYTVFTAGVLSSSKQVEAATALINHLSSLKAATVYKSQGLEPG